MRDVLAKFLKAHGHFEQFMHVNQKKVLTTTFHGTYCSYLGTTALEFAGWHSFFAGAACVFIIANLIWHFMPTE